MSDKIQDFETPAEYMDEVDQICDKFEKSITAGESPDINSFVTGKEDPLYSILLRELLVIELEHKSQTNIAPEQVSYSKLFSSHSHIVDLAFQHMNRIYQTADLSHDTTEFDEPKNKLNLDQKIQSNREIGRFKILGELGEGGQATVYRAFDPDLDRQVVIKLAQPGLHEKAKQLLIDEGKVLAKFNLPHMVQVYEVGIHQDRPFLVMEDIEGKSLLDSLNAGPLPLQEAISVTIKIADTLHQLHQTGFLHRDLKPPNILMTPSGEPKLIDFGLALKQSAWDQAEDIKDKSITGSLTYMAPEQAHGNLVEFGPWTDVFGLGATLYHLITGTTIYNIKDLKDDGTSKIHQLLELAREANCKSPASINTNIPPALDKICSKALAKDPAERYRSTAELSAALTPLVEKEKSFPLTGLIAGVAVLLVVILAVAFSGTTSEDPVPSVPGNPTPVTPEVKVLKGELKVTVWNKSTKTPKAGLEVIDPKALPVKNGEKVHLSATVSEAAYLYLFWISSEGEVIPLYPWDIRKGFSDSINEQQSLTQLESPTEINEGWPVSGDAGLETALLLARKTPLPEDLYLKEIFQKLPPATLHDDLKEVTELEVLQDKTEIIEKNISNTVKETEAPRSISLTSEQIEDPLLELIRKLQPHFDMIKAVRFAHVEK